MKLVECVANVSEGRDAASVQAIAAGCEAEGASWLLDVTSDADHHRSVISFVADGGAVVEAALSLIEAAAERIDLRRHRGVHPRIGAADVVPLVPVCGVALEECAAWARELGRLASARIGLPVYLYGAAARRAERRFLAPIRRGGFEGLREAIGNDPARQPDFGPSSLHPSAGAVCVGARLPMIAFNVYLETARREVAQAIAARVRSAGGGLPAVQALGFFIGRRRRAQVSMNLLDYRKTRPAQAFRAVDKLARRMGTRAASSELIGLAPALALRPGEVEEMKLEDFSEDRILEKRIIARGVPVGEELRKPQWPPNSTS